MPSRGLAVLMQRHRDDLIDLALLWLALQLPGWFGASAGVPAVAQVVAILAAAFSLPRKPAPPSSAWRRTLARLPAKLVAAAAAGAVFFFWFNLPGPTLAFAPTWVALLLARPPLQAAAGRAAQWPWGCWMRWAQTAGQRLARTYRLDIIAGGILIAAGGGGIAARLVTPGSAAGIASAAAGLAALLALYAFALRKAARRLGDSYEENLRWITLAFGAGWLLHRYATRAQYGTDDARWYATMLADFRAQVRTGILPVAIGQTPWQFNGAVFSFRVAPAYHYLGALLDQLTFRSLEVYALQHLLILVLGFGGIFSAYACLRAILPQRQWLAALLAWTWLACPGVAGLAFNTDLYMTWTTLPAIPWVVLGWVRIWENSQERAGWLNIGFGLGWTWWGHTPMAVWLSFFTGILGAAWILVRRPPWARLAGPALGAGISLSLALFPAVSYLEAVRRIGLGPKGFSETSAGTIVYFVQQAFPRVLLPVSSNGRELADFQLGWTLWIALAAGTGLALRRPRPALVGLVAIGGFLVLLLTPVPWLNYALWRVLPAAIRNATTNWAMNRLYLILAAVAAAAGAWVLAARSRPLPRWTLAVGALLLAWTVREAGKFSRLAPVNPTSDAGQMRPENIAITRNAYVVFPEFPTYFSEGVVDPELENRLLDGSGKPLLGNAEAAAARASVAESGAFQVVDDSGVRFLQLPAPLTLEPGRRYLLEFTYLKPNWAGVLQLAGPSLFRQYAMPEYGEAGSFGAGGGHSRFLPLSTSGPQAEAVRVRFLPRNPVILPGLRQPAWATVRLLSYSPADLPVRIESWLPYRARVSSDRAAWLETPRMYQQGYAATVDGNPAEVRRSPQALAQVAVPAGGSVVELRYIPSALFVGAFWLSLGGWVAAAAAGAWKVARG